MLNTASTHTNPRNVNGWHCSAATFWT